MPTYLKKVYTCWGESIYLLVKKYILVSQKVPGNFGDLFAERNVYKQLKDVSRHPLTKLC